MPRNIPDWLKDAILQPSTSTGLLTLADITWDDGIHAGDLHLVVSDQDEVSNGQTYTRSSFHFELPHEEETEVPIFHVVFDDVDLTIRNELVKLTNHAHIKLSFARLSDPDQIGFSVEGELRNVKLDEPVALGDVHLHDDHGTAPYPAIRYSRGFGYMALQ